MLESQIRKNDRDAEVLMPVLASVEEKLRDLAGKRARPSAASPRPSSTPAPAAHATGPDIKRARDEPRRAAGQSWGPAGGENDGTAVRRSPKAPKHNWAAGRKTTTSFSDDEDTSPPVRQTSNGGGGGQLSKRPVSKRGDVSKRNATPSFQSAGERLDAENAARGVPPAAATARRASVGDRHAHAHAHGGPHANGHGGASTSTARGGFVPPYVRKAFAGPAGGGQTRKAPPIGRGGTGASRGDANGERGGEVEAPFSEQVMCRLSPRGEPIPDELLRMDRDIVERVVSEILEAPASVAWDDIAGLKHAKAAVQELAVWPLMKPELFRGARAVPRGLLLFGPPGTGKTLIGRAVASQCGATFFSISASSLTSKWIGEGEKMVRALFAVARCCEPAVIFVDEIDSLLSARKSDGEHESSRRMKTEFLVQMDGLGGGDDGRLLLVGATNRPQELDDGARRRLAKQLYIPLPCADARRAIVVNILDADASVTHRLSDADLNVICEKTDGYSGSDMRHLVQEAARAPLRELFQSVTAGGGGAGGVTGGGGGGIPSGDVAEGVTPSAMRPIRLVDFKRASKQVRPSVTRADIDFHEEWNRVHGAMSLGTGADGDGDDDSGDDWG